LTLKVFQVNSYLLQQDDVAVLIDTGFDHELTRRLTQREQVPDVQAILLTHGHFDHAGGLVPLQQAFPNARTYLPRQERQLFELLPKQGEYVFGAPQFNRPCGRIDQWVDDGDTIDIGPIKLQFIATPGHTPGQGCYYDHQSIFVGDTLFAGSVGRTDFPLSDPQLAQQSLARLMDLPHHLKVYSGHGPVTTIGHEWHSNPFLDTVRHLKRQQSDH